MNFKGSNGTSLELKIVGYQFPALATEEYDSNWLQIQIRATIPEGSWTTTDPCLLTYEAAELADWFDAVHEGRASDDVLGFLEPNLRFEIRGNGARTLRI